jgi:dTDP-4-dehydrorhamnose reductase
VVNTRPVLVIGANGQLGTAISKAFPDVVRVGRQALDLSSVDLADRAHELMQTVKPRTVINCAAFTAVDRAESEVDEAMTLNALAVGVLAEVAAAFGVPFVTFSTDYVFDGTSTRPYVEPDLPSPINTYGRTKAVGESYALAHGDGSLVIRTSWLLSGTHSNFVSTILKRLRGGSSVRVVADQHGCPTVASDLASATVNAVGAGVAGILHLTNQGATTWFDLARTAGISAGYAEDLLEPCTSADYPTPARRPKNSILGSERRSSIGIELPPWQVSLDRVVTDLIAAGLA